MNAAEGAAAAPIWKDGGFGPDEWTRASPEAELSTAGSPLLVPLATFLAEPDRYLGRNEKLGVEVQAGEPVQMLEPYLWRLSLIALAFPKFHDGRSYSSARLLRERYHFRGELRAVGDVLQDQIPLMRRCGIDSFEVKHEPTRAALAEGRLPEMHRFYQPIPTAPREAPAGTRPWLRRPED
jgi:phosphoadenosine phosphosulfate reductase